MKYTLLVALLVLAWVTVSHESLLTGTVQQESRLYRAQNLILDELLSAECPGYASTRRVETSQQSASLEVHKIHYQRLLDELIRCRNRKSQSTTNTPANICDHGEIILDLHFLKFVMASGAEAVGEVRRTFNICISALNDSTCGYFHGEDISKVKERSTITFSNKFSSLKNPLELKIHETMWRGVNIHIEMRDADSAQRVSLNEEFTYDFMDPPGRDPRLVTLYGTKYGDRTRLSVVLSIRCSQKKFPEDAITTADTTPSTTATSLSLATTSTALPILTTTAISLPQKCVTASNVTESWRMDHLGKDLKGGGAHSAKSGYACDLHSGLQWFRFTGDAGNKMLNTCPAFYSCGTKFPYWTDDAMPQPVGVVSTIHAYGVSNRDCRAGKIQIEVMRCSLATPHDFIYRYTSNKYGYYEECQETFCGMS